MEEKHLVEEKRLREEEEKQLVELKKIEEEKKINVIVEKRLAEEKKIRQEEEKRKLEAKRLALEEQKSKEEEAAKASVTIIFIRKSRFVGMITDDYISQNGTQIGSLSNGSFFITSVPSGTNNFDGAATFEFEPNQIYYIDVIVGFGPTIHQLISKAEGRAAMKGLKNVGNTNPVDVLSDYDESEAYKEPATQHVPSL